MRFSILHSKNILENLVALNPDNIGKREGIFKNREKRVDIAYRMSLKSIYESISECTFSIGFLDPFIGYSKTRTHEYFIKARIVFGDECDRFFCKDIHCSWLLRHDSYWFFKGSVENPFSHDTWRIDFPDLMHASECTF